jgi:hypothetical protein
MKVYSLHSTPSVFVPIETFPNRERGRKHYMDMILIANVPSALPTLEKMSLHPVSSCSEARAERDKREPDIHAEQLLAQLFPREWSTSQQT